MAKALDAELTLLTINKGKYGEIAHLVVRQKGLKKVTSDIKIILLGDSTSGKSTLLGVMVSGKRDNGKGLARQKAFKHSHQLANGTECTVNFEIMGFNASCKVTNGDEAEQKSVEDIYKDSYKVLTFIDIKETSENIKHFLYESGQTLPKYVML
jgi:GTPase